MDIIVLTAQPVPIGLVSYLKSKGLTVRVCSTWPELVALVESGLVPAPPDPNPVLLTPREGETVRTLVSGLPNKDIALAMGITEGSVKVYLSRLFLKVGAEDRLRLALWGLANMDFLPVVHVKDWAPLPAKKR